MRVFNPSNAPRWRALFPRRFAANRGAAWITLSMSELSISSPPGRPARKPKVGKREQFQLLLAPLLTSRNTTPRILTLFVLMNEHDLAAAEAKRLTINR